MEAADVKVDVVAYNSAIAACAKGGDWEQAWAVFSSKWSLIWACTVGFQPAAFKRSLPKLAPIGHTCASADTSRDVKNACVDLLDVRAAGSLRHKEAVTCVKGYSTSCAPQTPTC